MSTEAPKLYDIMAKTRVIFVRLFGSERFFSARDFKYSPKSLAPDGL